MRQSFQKILCLTFLALTLEGCQYFKNLFGPVLQEPHVSVKEVQVVSIKPFELKLKIKFLIQNPNSFALEFSNFNYRIALSNRPIANGTYKEKILLPSEQNTIIEVPLSVASHDAFQIIRERLHTKGKLSLELSGSVDFHSGFGAMTIRFDHEREIY